MLPTLTRLSVRDGPGSRLRHRCSSRYLRISPLHREFHSPLPSSRTAVRPARLWLSQRISQAACGTAYAPFMPSESEQRLPPSSYRSCWHEVSCGFLPILRQPGVVTSPVFVNRDRSLQPEGLHSSTRRRSVRLAPIAEDSRLQPPVGVWPVSQCQCARPTSQSGYPSKPWWAVTPPTS